jgi:hypothetical protein
MPSAVAFALYHEDKAEELERLSLQYRLNGQYISAMEWMKKSHWHRELSALLLSLDD